MLDFWRASGKKNHPLKVCLLSFWHCWCLKTAYLMLSFTVKWSGFFQRREERNESWDLFLHADWRETQWKRRRTQQRLRAARDQEFTLCRHRWRRTELNKTRRGHALEGRADGAQDQHSNPGMPCPISSLRSKTHRRITIFFFGP